MKKPEENQKEEKDFRVKLLLELNDKIKKENDKYKVESLFQNKYGWGVDQVNNHIFSFNLIIFNNQHENTVPIWERKSIEKKAAKVKLNYLIKVF